MSTESLMPSNHPSSVALFSFCLQYFPASGSFPVSKLYLLFSVQFSCSVMSNSLRPHGPHQASLSITNTWSLLKLTSIKLVVPSNHLILCHPLLHLPSIFPIMRVFSNKSVLPVRWPKYWSFSSVAVLPMNIQDWFPLGLTGSISLQSKGLSRVFSNTTVQKHQFK